MIVWAEIFVRNGKVVHIASSRNLHFVPLKIVLVNTLSRELYFPRFLQRKGIVVLPDFKPKRLEL